MNKRNKHIGSDFNDFLQEEGILEETEAVAVKRVLTFELQESMKRQHLNKNPYGQADAHKPLCHRQTF